MDEFKIDHPMAKEGIETEEEYQKRKLLELLEQLQNGKTLDQ